MASNGSSPGRAAEQKHSLGSLLRQKLFWPGIHTTNNAWLRVVTEEVVISPEELRPHPPSVQGPDGLVWAGQRWPEAPGILILRIHNRQRFGSAETASVQPKPLRFTRNRFG